MRIERLDIEDYGRLTGSFAFPETGLALWNAPNGAGKSTLTNAVLAAFYGEPGATGWIQLAFRLDDGTHGRIVRDLGEDRVQVLSEDGEDVTERFRPPGLEVGRGMFGLSREDLAEVLRLRADDLRSTVGNAALLMLVAASASSESGTDDALPPPPPLPPRPPGETDPVAATESGDFQIFRNTGEELGLFPPGEVPPLDVTIEHGDVHSDLTAGLEVEGETAAEAPEPDPDEPGLAPAERMRRLAGRLRSLERRHETRQGELRDHAERITELQVENERLATLSGAEPQDVEDLRAVLEGLKRVDRERRALADGQENYRGRLEGRGISGEHLQRLAARFGTVAPETLAFLRGYRQADSIRRGTRALVRSEHRLDDSKLGEIRKTRDKAARIAALPLALAVAGVFGSLAVHFFELPFPDPNVALAVGILGATLGALLLWWARRLREEDRQQLSTSQQRKDEQIAQLDEESQEAEVRLRELAAEWKMESPEAILEQLDTWEAHAAELDELEQFAKRSLSMQREEVSLREKLGRFAAAHDGRETRDVSLLDADQVYKDYVRYFSVRRELEEADHRSLELEADLADLEMDRGDCRERIDQMLAEVGIDADRDLDEAVEMFARRIAQGGIFRDPGDLDEGLPSVPPARTAALAARARAILQRMVPSAREVTLDERLIPSVRFDDHGEALDMPGMVRELSASTLDQVCLALRLAIVETPSPAGEKVPTFLDDPLVRADDARHDCAIGFLVDDACERGQVLLMTAHEVRVKWYLHQHPAHRPRITSVAPPASVARRPSSASVAAPSGSSSSRS